MIRTKVVNVFQAFDGAFILLTESLSSIILEHCLDDKDTIQDYKMFVIRTKGIFESYIQIAIEDHLLGGIVNAISKGKKLDETERILYIMEYLNIVCGRALSEINNQVGKSSRLTVPQYIRDVTYEEPFLDGEQENLFFDSEYGKMNVSITYHYDSER
ncbi:chemotaxis protein CheX [Velocimicrobium porci]|uniref:Chemotaxis phosphatase CheX-like domain-containing protein n=1 Tax=Velocimicrobium porci TaxID=2606634 RepID=A0A6L5Y0I3_9FIRM|nr:chemotaxis protein CheX [Velocimicrobium porci]MSS64221.1 hypothetical protein [Velocimicrobium porci]